MIEKKNKIIFILHRIVLFKSFDSVASKQLKSHSFTKPIGEVLPSIYHIRKKYIQCFKVFYNLQSNLYNDFIKPVLAELIAVQPSRW